MPARRNDLLPRNLIHIGRDARACALVGLAFVLDFALPLFQLPVVAQQDGPQATEVSPEPFLESLVGGTPWLPGNTHIHPTRSPSQIEVSLHAPDESPLFDSTRAIWLHAKLVRVADNQTLHQQTKVLPKDGDHRWAPIQFEVPAVPEQAVCSWQVIAEQEGEHAWSRFSKPSTITKQTWGIYYRESTFDAQRHDTTKRGVLNPPTVRPQWKTIETLDVSGPSSLRSARDLAVRDLNGTVHRWTSNIRLGSVGRWINKARLPSLTRIAPISVWSRKQDDSKTVTSDSDSDSAKLADSTEVTPWLSGEKIRVVFPTSIDEGQLHRITVRFRKHDDAVFSIRPMHFETPHNVAQLYDSRKQPSLGTASDVELEEGSFLVTPKNGLVDLELVNHSHESVGLASVSLQTQSRDLAATKSSSNHQAGVFRHDSGQPSLFVRMAERDWLTQLTPDMNEDRVASEHGDAAAHTHRVVVAVSRLKRLLGLHGSNGIVLESESLNQPIAFDGSSPWTLQHALQAQEVGIIREQFASEESPKTPESHDHSWDNSLTGTLIKTDLSAHESVVETQGQELILHRVGSSTSPASMPVTIASRGLYPIGSRSPSQKTMVPGTSTDCAVLVRTLPLSDMSDDETFYELGVGGAALQDLQSFIGQHAPKAIILDCSLACFPVSDQFAEIMHRFHAPLPTRLNPMEVGHFESSPPTWIRERIPSADEANQTVMVEVNRPADSMASPLRVSVHNTAPWPTTVTLRCDRPGIWNLEPESKPSGSVSSLPSMVQDLALEPGQWTTLTVHAVNELGANSQETPLRLSPWSSTIDGGSDAMSAIQWSVTRVVERIGLLDRFSHESYQTFDRCGFEDVHLSNGGFEQSGDVGLAGWVHAQFPTEAVGVDSEEAWEGGQSIRLTNEAGTSNRAWLVSEAIPAPPSGRLAVTAAVRGQVIQADQDTTDAVPSSAKMKLRVTLEGIHHDKPIRRSMEVELNNNGKWNPDQILLETQLLPPGTKSYRLAIDSLTPGTIWLDDIQIHSWFPLRSERKRLQTQAYLAVEGLRRGKTTAAAQLLQNQWSTQLLDWASHRSAQPSLNPNGSDNVPTIDRPHFMDRPQMRAVTERTPGSFPPLRRAASHPPVRPFTPSNLSKKQVGSEPPRQNQIQPTKAVEDSPPSVAERIRSWLPRPLRF